MMKHFPTSLALAATLGLVACGDSPKLSSMPGETGSEDEDTGGTELGDPGEGEGETDTGGEHTFIPDVGEGEEVHECDPWAQDCPEGEKCVPYGSTGGNWDANKCVPVLGDGQPGDACTWDGTSAATDSCGADSHCWDVMEVDGQLEGVCTPFCDGTPNDPICGPETSCLIANEGSITLCIQTCDPLLQECADGLGCFWANNDFNCIFTAGEIQADEPCGFVNDCAPGLFCASAEVLPSCESSACCTAYCDLSIGECSNPDTECAPFFEEGTAPPNYEDIGLCIVPGA
jgi:hypothetical protein